MHRLMSNMLSICIKSKLLSLLMYSAYERFYKFDIWRYINALLLLYYYGRI